MIITGNMKFRTLDYGDIDRNTTYDRFRLEKIIPSMAKKGIRETPPKLLVGEPMKAIVNRGRWIVRCECGGAEYAFEEGIFMCQSCFNSGHLHKYRPVEFPKNRKKIEALLEKRALINRNWEIIDTLKDLEDDNKKHKQELL